MGGTKQFLDQSLSSKVVARTYMNSAIPTKLDAQPKAV